MGLGDAQSLQGLDEREAEMYRLRVVNRWTLEKIGNQFGVSNQRVSQILQGVQAKLPPLDFDAMRRESLELYLEIQRKALELAALAGAPVTAGKDGDIVRDPEGGAVVRDYAGRIAALKLAKEADIEIRKLHGLDAATKQEISGSVRYEVVGVDLDALT